jgi:CBS domain-containing protein
VNGSGRLEGVITRKDLHRVQEGALKLRDVIKTRVVTAYPDEPLRLVVYRMAETGLTRLPVVEREDPQKLVGMISLTDLLRARTRDLEEERRRERVLRLRFPFASREAVSADTRPA